MTRYQAGNTIRCEATFKDFSGNKIDPPTIKFIIYDSQYNVEAEHMITEANKLGEGTYYFDLVTSPSHQAKRGFYEWYAEIDGKPALSRHPYSTTFV